MRKKSKKHYRNHPVLILYNSRWVIFVILLPLIRAVKSFLQGDFVNWNLTSWLDVSIIVGIFALSTLSWSVFTYNIDDKGIKINSGIVVRRNKFINWDKITLIKERRPFYLRIINAGYVKIDTTGGDMKNVDAQLCLSRKKSNNLIQKYKTCIGKNEAEKVNYIFKPALKSIMTMAIISMNNFAGVIYIITLITQSGKILGEGFAEVIVERFEEFTRSVATKIPPATMAIAYFLVFAWIIGVVSTLLRYYNYKIECSDNSLLGTSGLFGKHKQIINLDRLSYINIRQNIFSYFLGLKSLFAVTAGSFKENSELNCTIPNENDIDFYKHTNFLFPKYIISKSQIKPAATKFSFMLITLGVSIGTILTTLILIYKIPNWRSFLSFFCIMLLVPTIILGIVSVLEKDMGGIGIKDNYLTIRYTRFFTINTVTIELDKIMQLQVRQSLFQKLVGNANVYVYTISEGIKKHKCRNYNFRQVDELIKANLGSGYDYEN